MCHHHVPVLPGRIGIDHCSPADLMKKILVVGSSNTDLIIKVSEIPRPGETLLGRDFQSFPGGKGANQAVAAARAGGDVIFIASVGDDDYGKDPGRNGYHTS